MPEQQQEFVRWWDDSVSVRQSPGTNQWSNAELRWTMSKDQAEHDTLITQQQEFVEWWDDCVGILHGAGRGHKNNAERGSFSKDQAERDTDITQQQVSRWRGRLADAAKYRAQQILAATHPKFDSAV